MIAKYLKILFGIVLVGIAFEGAGATPVPAVVQADNYLQSLSRAQRFAGVVLVARNGQPLFFHAYGLAVRGWNIPNKTSTRFEIASLTKQFTGAAILQLADKGLLSLDDPVSRYYANAPSAWSPITIRELAQHTSGLPNNEIANFTKGIAVSYSLEELIGTFRNRPLAHDPGTAWAYTNTEYYLLAYIIERVSGQSYSDYLHDHLLVPAGMTQSSDVPTLAIVPNGAEGYARDGKRFRHRDYFDRSLEAGAGGISSTAMDLLKWNVALDSGRVLSSHAYRTMFTPDPLGQYGFGWFISRKPRLRQYHEGSDPGFAAFEARYPDDRLVVIVLSNIEDAPVRDIEGQLSKMFLQARTR